MRVFKTILIVLLVLALLVAAAGAIWQYFLRDGSTYLQLAQHMETVNQPQWAVRCYRWAWNREPHNASIPLMLADSYARNGNYTKCEATLWEAIERMPGATELYLALSKVYVEQNKLLDAAALTDEILQADAKAAFEAARPAAPTIQPAGGEYETDCIVSLAYSSGSAYWTLDGACPSIDTDLYSVPVRLMGQTATVTALVVGDNGTVSPIVTADYVVGFVDEPVTIADPALDALLRETMGWVGSVQLTTGMLSQVTALTLTPEVSDLSQFPLLTNLTELDATALGHSADWTVLRSLTHLQTLRLPSTTLDPAAYEAIGTLTDLRILSLADCGLTTLAPLQNLTALEELDLSSGSIGDCTPLSGMTNLRLLRLGGNAVTDLSPLQNLTALEELDLHENPVHGLSPLREMREMRHLNIASTGADTLEALVYMTDLETLDASGNAITTINVLSRMPKLTELNLSGNAITVANSLTKLTKLTRLELNSNQLKTLPDFDDSCALVYFSATHNQLQDVEGLSNLSRLNYVYVDYNQITTLAPLETCRVLVQVDAFENPVRVAQTLIDSSVIVHYTPVFDAETGQDQSVEPEEAVEETTEETDEASGEETGEDA